jgi:carbon storage regulator
MSDVVDRETPGRTQGVPTMLVLTRKVGEELVVPQCRLTVKVLEATSGRVRLGITAPSDLLVYRSELCERIRAEATLDVGGAMKSIRILIADRDEFLLATYREHLCRYGAIVATATTGLTCLEQLRDFLPDVLVLDPAIPWGGGDGVLALMHEEPAIRPASVLLLTHRGDRSLLYRLSSYRVDDYQAKPLNPGQLAHRICILRVLVASDTIPNPDAVSPCCT